jgi:dihydroorotate dehydrogenase
MYKIAKFFLFKIDPEKAHYFSAFTLKVCFKIPFIAFLFKKKHIISNANLETEVFGLKFSNPVGLAAGFDKNATLFKDFENFGFGFIEIGTVTPKPQLGNEKPRLFRLIEDEAVINRMGFNNDGVELISNRLKNRKTNLIIGGNIGKNKLTENEKAKNDYLICFNALFDYVDYFVVNVSSPNTPNLRDLQEKEPLKELLHHLMYENNLKNKPKPILLKIAPDLTNTQLDDIIEIVKETSIAGVIATNTTISRENLKTKKEIVDEIGMGGLSGKPLNQRSTEVIKYLSEKSNKAFPIIGVGGIHDAKDAIEKIQAGASLVQIYTGFIYKGPKLVKEINQEILKLRLNASS